VAEWSIAAVLKNNTPNFVTSTKWTEARTRSWNSLNVPDCRKIAQNVQN
jgi:hypothetical protein